METPFNKDEFTLAAAGGDLVHLTEESWRALNAWNSPEVMFRSANRPWYIERDDEGRLVLRPVTVERMLWVLARCVEWIRVSDKQMVKARPPREVASQMLATPELPLPVLTRIVQAPVFASDGTLQIEPGYHAKSRTYFDAADGFEVPAIPERPSRDLVTSALSFIVDEWLVDFPFRTAADLAHAIGLFLLPFVREMITGATPLHLVDKPTPGTGAGLLIDVLLRPSIGGAVGSMPETKDEDELRKQITSALLQSPTAILFDNLTGTLRSAVLNTALTEPIWTARILGGNEMARLPIRVVWVASANNLTLNTDSVRRAVQIRLDARSSQPWLRTGFRHPDLRSWTDEHRSELVAAALVLVRAWIAAGSPAGKVPALGSYGEWSRVLGGILQVSGIGGFLSNLDEFYATATADDEGTLWLLEAWRSRHGEKDVTASDLWPLVDRDECPIDLIGRDERAKRVYFGRQIVSKVRDRHFTMDDGAEFRVEKVGTRQRASVWRLAVVRDPSGFGEASEASEGKPLAENLEESLIEGGSEGEVLHSLHSFTSSRVTQAFSWSDLVARAQYPHDDEAAL